MELEGGDWICDQLSPTHCDKHGNGYVMHSIGEQCDDGNFNNGDGCDEFMQIESDDGWFCSGPTTHPSHCDQHGNGHKRHYSGEECDDGNFDNGDGCDEFMQVEPGWQCAEINYYSPSECDPPGNGIRHPVVEQCDDGNLDLNDGCNAHMRIERGWSCNITVNPSRCGRPGNGVWEPWVGEECDDGNHKNGDGCD